MNDWKGDQRLLYRNKERQLYSLTENDRYIDGCKTNTDNSTINPPVLERDVKRKERLGNCLIGTCKY